MDRRWVAEALHVRAGPAAADGFNKVVVGSGGLERRVRQRGRLRALYKMSRTGGYALAVLSPENFTTAYKRMRYLGIFPARDQRMMAEYSAGSWAKKRPIIPSSSR